MLNVAASGQPAHGIISALYPALECERSDGFDPNRARCTQPGFAEPEREALIVSHLDDVKRIARGIARKLPSSVQFDDLVQAGMLGLIDAARRFDSSRPRLFPQYARIRITGAIYDSLRDLDWASRYMRTRQQKLENTSTQLERSLGREPSSDEIADALGMDLDTFYEFAVTVQDVQRVELDAQPSDEHCSAPEQVAADPQQAPDAVLFAKETRQHVRKAISELPTDERTVMFLYYICDWKMEAIARRIRRTESRVSQIHSRAVSRLRQRLGSRLRNTNSNRPFQVPGGKLRGVH